MRTFPTILLMVAVFTTLISCVQSGWSGDGDTPEFSWVETWPADAVTSPRSSIDLDMNLMLYGIPLTSDDAGNVYTGRTSLRKYGPDGALVFETDLSDIFDFGAMQVNHVNFDQDGNIYAAGFVILHPEFTSTHRQLQTTNFLQASLVKLDPDGDVLWAINIPGTGPGGSYVKAIHFDENGNPIVLGNYTTNFQIDFEWVFDPACYRNWTSSVDRDETAYNSFMIKLNTEGNYLWSFEWDGQLGTSITDRDGNIIAALSSRNFDSVTEKFADVDLGYEAPLIVKLNLDGEPVETYCVNGYTGLYEWQEGEIESMTHNSIITSGMSGETITPGMPSALGVDSDGDIYVLQNFGHVSRFADWVTGRTWFYKINVEGEIEFAHEIHWARTFCIDDSDNIYLTGSFKSWAPDNVTDLDPTDGTANYAAETFDVPVVKLKADGEFIWAGAFGGMDDDVGYTIAATGGGIYVTGTYKSEADFNPGTAEASMTSESPMDIFVVKFTEQSF